MIAWKYISADDCLEGTFKALGVHLHCNLKIWTRMQNMKHISIFLTYICVSIVFHLGGSAAHIKGNIINGCQGSCFVGSELQNEGIARKLSRARIDICSVEFEEN